MGEASEKSVAFPESLVADQPSPSGGMDGCVDTEDDDPSDIAEVLLGVEVTYLADINSRIVFFFSNELKKIFSSFQPKYCMFRS